MKWEGGLPALSLALVACAEPFPRVGVSEQVELARPPPPRPTASASAKPPPRPPPEEQPYVRWRIALEAYTPRANPAAGVPLSGETAEDFMKYIRRMHDGVHPLFVEATTPLDEASGNDPLKNPALTVEIEVTLVGATGKIKRLGVVRRSEVVDFDMIALDAIKNAAPFEPAPESLRSPDGNVYVRWTFRRSPDDGCSARQARGIKLRAPPWPP